MKFIDELGTFELENADCFSDLYFPLGSETGLKSVVSPDLGGDSKTDQNHFLLEPVSIEGLRNNKNSRNFWVLREGKTPWSLTGNSVWQQAEGVEHTKVTAGTMWHMIERESSDKELRSSITSFVPVEKNVEIHLAKIENCSMKNIEIEFVSAIPMYGRSADNIRDHRHVTSLLHRVSTDNRGVVVNPTLSFDERGHQLNDTFYYTKAISGEGELPKSFIPVLADFVGEGGTLERPKALLGNRSIGVNAGYSVNGVEAVGGIFFEKKVLKPGETVSYITFIGIETSEERIDRTLEYFRTKEDVIKELKTVKEYWKRKINVTYHTGNPEFDGFMHWVSFQPELRRLFGCSFLPHHDYGKGGRGWRDLWQDCLALLLMDPSGVRQMLVGNFEGVRTDGTNATIIGSKLGEFKADRNGITRVWMDHAFWPLMTTALYIDQTGDLDILLEKVPYYKDRQVLRGTGIDEKWDGETLREKDTNNEVYRGTILEHLLLETLTETLETGEHGNIKLRDADWNDAVDMAGKKGESVAFTHAYAGNLVLLSNLLEEISKTHQTIEMLEEMTLLLNDGPKSEVLKEYIQKVSHGVTGNTKSISIEELSKNLLGKAHDMRSDLRNHEWIELSTDKGFFRGYYDNDGNSLEKGNGDSYHMTLTGQVFAIMSNTATKEDIKKITRAADELLFDGDCGGYRLNTDFDEIKTNMGRMFGFAYGEKENGAVFSHMAVMYANALYKRGFAHEGFKVLNSLYSQSMDFEKGHIYPGIPEYFGRGGRGLYHYLTGAASWYMMTVVNQMFGVRGEYGKLVIEPKLLKEQFDENHEAAIELTFKGEALKVIISNPSNLDFGEYKVAREERKEDVIHVLLDRA